MGLSVGFRGVRKRPPSALVLSLSLLAHLYGVDSVLFLLRALALLALGRTDDFRLGGRSMLP